MSDVFGILVFTGKSNVLTGFTGEIQQMYPGDKKGVGDYDGNSDRKQCGYSQSTENAKTQEKTANPPLTNVRHRSIIPVLLLTKCEYYPIGGCIV